MSVKQIIAEATNFAGKLIPRKKKEVVEDEFSFDDHYFTIFY